jgi:hypothetical protein
MLPIPRLLRRLGCLCGAAETDWALAPLGAAELQAGALHGGPYGSLRWAQPVVAVTGFAQPTPTRPRLDRFERMSGLGRHEDVSADRRGLPVFLSPLSYSLYPPPGAIAEMITVGETGAANRWIRHHQPESPDWSETTRSHAYCLHLLPTRAAQWGQASDLSRSWRRAKRVRW